MESEGSLEVAFGEIERKIREMGRERVSFDLKMGLLRKEEEELERRLREEVEKGDDINQRMAHLRNIIEDKRAVKMAFQKKLESFKECEVPSSIQVILQKGRSFKSEGLASVFKIKSALDEKSRLEAEKELLEVEFEKELKLIDEEEHAELASISKLTSSIQELDASKEVVGAEIMKNQVENEEIQGRIDSLGAQAKKLDGDMEALKREYAMSNEKLDVDHKDSEDKLYESLSILIAEKAARKTRICSVKQDYLREEEGFKVLSEEESHLKKSEVEYIGESEIIHVEAQAIEKEISLEDETCQEIKGVIEADAFNWEKTLEDCRRISEKLELQSQVQDELTALQEEEESLKKIGEDQEGLLVGFKEERQRLFFQKMEIEGGIRSAKDVAVDVKSHSSLLDLECTFLRRNEANLQCTLDKIKEELTEYMKQIMTLFNKLSENEYPPSQDSTICSQNQNQPKSYPLPETSSESKEVSSQNNFFSPLAASTPIKSSQNPPPKSPAHDKGLQAYQKYIQSKKAENPSRGAPPPRPHKSTSKGSKRVLKMPSPSKVKIPERSLKGILKGPTKAKQSPKSVSFGILRIKKFQPVVFSSSSESDDDVIPQVKRAKMDPKFPTTPNANRDLKF